MKKRLSLLLALVMLLSACLNGAFADETAEPEKITLESIAALNGCAVSDLNVTCDEHGHITFLGDLLCEQKVLSEQDSITVLTRLWELLTDEDLELVLYDVSVSPVTGVSYYSFYETVEREIQPGVTALFDNKAGCVKLIVDKDGSAIGCSSCLCENDRDETVLKEPAVSAEEAEQFVSLKLAEYGKDAKVYPEFTDCVYLYDETAISYCGLQAKRLPVWIVVTDLELLPGKKGTAFLISMVHVPETAWKDLGITEEANALGCAEMIPLDAPDAASLETVFDAYTSLIYFESMTDAGTYTYTVSESDWVTDAKEPEKLQTREITVPVMYDTREGLYVLGDLNTHLLVADCFCYATMRDPVPNMIVSEDPSDIGSWHWKKPVIKDREGGEITLQLNMAYALCSYETLLNVSKNYADTIGVEAYDAKGMPQLLLLYLHDGETYPAEGEQFMMNAYNIGALNDWGVMATSPALSAAMDETVIGHEYAHGIDAFNSGLIYRNITGAVEESFADIMGLSLYNAVHGTDIVEPGALSPFGSIRSMKEPEKFSQPRYFEGRNYSPTIDTDIEEIYTQMDQGGVHSNSGVTNYLAYSISPANAAIKGTALGYDEILKLFYEASFARSTDFDYAELGAYLMFGAKLIGLSPAKTATLDLYRTALGFTEDKTVIRLLVQAQGDPVIRVKADFTEADPSIVAVTGLSMKSMTAGAFWGLLDEEPNTLVLTPEDLGTTILSVFTNYKTGEPVSTVTMLPNASVLEGDVTVTVKTLRLEKGTEYDFGAEVDCFIGMMSDTAFRIEGEPTRLSFPYVAENIVSCAAAPHEIVIYQVITGTPEEIEADIPLIEERMKQEMEEMMDDFDEDESEDLSDADLAA